MTTVALAQDHIVQAGGGELVLASMVRAFPSAALYTTFFRPEATFPIFEEVDVRTSPLNQIAWLRNHHRSALPLMAPAISRLRVDADVLVCGSSGWAHGVPFRGRKVVYFHAVAAWLYSPDTYLAGRGFAPRVGLRLLRGRLARWDRRHAATAHRVLVYGKTMQRRVRDVLGVDAEVLAPPVAIDPAGAAQALDLEPGFLFCAARLMPYKNVDVVLEALGQLPGERLVIAGDGPEAERLRRLAPANVTFIGRADVDRMRWLYASCSAVVAAGYEAYGLTPVEAAAFGKPTVALGQGGLVDTVTDGVTGALFAHPDPSEIVDAVRRLRGIEVDSAALAALHAQHSEGSFIARLQAVVAEEAAKL